MFLQKQQKATETANEYITQRRGDSCLYSAIIVHTLCSPTKEGAFGRGGLAGGGPRSCVLGVEYRRGGSVGEPREGEIHQTMWGAGGTIGWEGGAFALCICTTDNLVI